MSGFSDPMELGSPAVETRSHSDASWDHSGSSHAGGGSNNGKANFWGGGGTSAQSGDFDVWVTPAGRRAGLHSGTRDRLADGGGGGTTDAVKGTLQHHRQRESSLSEAQLASCFRPPATASERSMSRVMSDTSVQAAYQTAKRLRDEIERDTSAAAAVAAVAVAAAGASAGASSYSEGAVLAWAPWRRRPGATGAAAAGARGATQPLAIPAAADVPAAKVAAVVIPAALVAAVAAAAKAPIGEAEATALRLSMATPPASKLDSLSNDAIMAALLPHAPAMPTDVHPEQFLHEILRARGYDTEKRPALSTPYHRLPTPEQISGYDSAIVQAVREDDVGILADMRASGRCMNACNRYGESVLHMSCRRGNAAALRVLLQDGAGGTVAASDDYGRTPLHDACWTAEPAFDVVTILLNHDLKLLRIADKRGSTPLHYIRQEHWPLWCAFFDTKKEIYWRALDRGEPDPDAFQTCFGPATVAAAAAAGTSGGAHNAACMACV
ncbi:unnamed protein product [Phaeothamnion confervicola]